MEMSTGVFLLRTAQSLLTGRTICSELYSFDATKSEVLTEDPKPTDNRRVMLGIDEICRSQSEVQLDAGGNEADMVAIYA